MASSKIGRDSGSGKFIPVEQARRDKQGATVETIKRSPPPPPPPAPSKKK